MLEKRGEVPYAIISGRFNNQGLAELKAVQGGTFSLWKRTHPPTKYLWQAFKEEVWNLDT